MEDRLDGDVESATSEGNPLKVKAYGWHRYETGPGGSGWNQSAERVRNPEGAAQLEEATPVLVATHC
jgi:hypothetical protein